MDNVCHKATPTMMKRGIDINFITFSNGKKQILKTWWDWQGVIPQVGDVIILHWGPNSEEEDPWKVTSRIISGTEEKKLTLVLDK